MSTLIAEFTVVGTPVPQGSTRAFAGKGKAAGRAFITNDPTGTIGKWRGDIRQALQGQRQLATTRGFVEPPATPVDAPISMRLVFRFARPASHFLPVNAKRSTPELKPSAPAQQAVTGGRTGDLDKLVRAVLDALTGVLYLDDAQVVVIGALKRWSDHDPRVEQPGVDVRVSAL